MSSKYEVETKEIGFFIQMTTQILILFVLVLFIFSIIFPRQDMLVLTVVFVIVVGAFILSTKNKVKLWKKKWNR
jgi:TRAP-type C4-dicarboxylate transport system permease large subunit